MDNTLIITPGNITRDLRLSFVGTRSGMVLHYNRPCFYHTNYIVMEELYLHLADTKAGYDNSSITVHHIGTDHITFTLSGTSLGKFETWTYSLAWTCLDEDDMRHLEWVMNVVRS